MHHVKDKTKIKIIDLKDCLSNKSLDFFTNLLGTDILKTQHPETEEPYTYWDWTRNHTGTNKPVYKLFIDKLLQSNSNFLKNSSVEYYLRNEYEIYDSLINSPYYVNLKD
jgi:exonuclease III